MKEGEGDGWAGVEYVCVCLWAARGDEGRGGGRFTTCAPLAASPCPTHPLVHIHILEYHGTHKHILIRITHTHTHTQPPYLPPALLLQVVDHPNICRLFETFHDRIHVHLVMSPCSGMSLRSFVESRKLLESELAKYARVMISVVIYLHSQKLQHRGLRLTSFVFETAAAGGGGQSADATLKLSDLGVDAKYG